jgi:hypothetical protein
MNFTPYQISLGPPRELQVGVACDKHEKRDKSTREFVAKPEGIMPFRKTRPN